MKELNLLRFHKKSFAQIHQELEASKAEKSKAGRKKSKTKKEGGTDKKPFFMKFLAAAVVLAAITFAVVYYWPDSGDNIVADKGSEPTQDIDKTAVDQPDKGSDTSDDKSSDEQNLINEPNSDNPPDENNNDIPKKESDYEKQGYVKFGEFEFLEDTVPDKPEEKSSDSKPEDIEKKADIEADKQKEPGELAQLEKEPEPRKLELTKEIYREQELAKKKAEEEARRKAYVKPWYLHGDYYLVFEGINSKGYVALQGAAKLSNVQFTVLSSKKVGTTTAWSVYKIVKSSKKYVYGKPVQFVQAYTDKLDAIRKAKESKPALIQKIDADVKKFNIKICCLTLDKAKIMAKNYKSYGDIVKIIKYKGK